MDSIRYENSWPPEFSRLRDLHDDETLVETKKEVNADGDELDIFFTDSGDTASPCEVEVSKTFCWGSSLKKVQSGTGTAGHRKAIWLDDRSNSPELGRSGQGRQYENPLTATALFRILTTPRFNQEGLPDAARRLIYITDLDPACIHAIAATASCHQAAVLKNAIYEHLAFQTSIAVKLPSAGFLKYQLDLHLPFFLLRKSTPPEESVTKINTKPRRAWKDLSFLKLDTSISQDQEPKEVWGMHEAQISCVITGWDDWRWVGYGFVDTEIDGFLTDLSEDDLKFDPISGGELEANKPILRPRDYYLKVFEVRIEQVRKEWENLIYKIELGVKQYKNEHPFTLSQRSGTAGARAEEMKEAFDWALQMMDLLRQLEGTLSSTTEAWKSFNSADGDIGYFHDSNPAAISPKAGRSLLLIKATFRQLQGYRKQITLLNEYCSNYSKALELRLILESKEAADKNGTTAEFMVSILYPIALAAAIFSMQLEVIPFDPNPRSFALAVFILIAMTYAVRVVISKAILYGPSLLKLIVLLIKMMKLGKSGDEPSRKTSGDIFPPTRGGVVDEERNVP